MRFGDLLRGLTMRGRHMRRLELQLASALERVKRLEIGQIDAMDILERVDSRLERAANRRGGALGGRPPKVGKGRPLRLEDIPYGDKAALREYYRLNPPATASDKQLAIDTEH